MSLLAWRILALFIDHVQRVYKGEFGRGYIAAWTLGELLGGDAATIQAWPTRRRPRNEYERALKELLELGIVKEVPMLHECFQLVVRGEQEQKHPENCQCSECRWERAREHDKALKEQEGAMKFSDWLEPDTLAILCTAIFYGVPSQGHKNCYKEMIADRQPRHEQIKDKKRLEGTLCIACGEPLIQKQGGD